MSAAVVVLHNASHRAQIALPLLFTLTDGAGRKLFSNDSPGASPDLTTVPSLGPRATLAWIDDALINIAGATAVRPKLGPGKPEGRKAPRLRLSAPRLEQDPVDGATAVGKVFNESTVVQERLVIFGVARRAGRIVAAGRAVVPTLKPGPKGARFTIFLVGDPRGAKLTIAAPPVSYGSTR